MTDGDMDKPVRLSDDEVAYHVFLVKQIKEAQEAQARIAQAQGARANWADYLKDKYGFSDGDVITEDGTIVTEPMSGHSVAGSASLNGASLAPTSSA